MQPSKRLWILIMLATMVTALTVYYSSSKAGGDSIVFCPRPDQCSKSYLLPANTSQVNKLNLIETFRIPRLSSSQMPRVVSRTEYNAMFDLLQKVTDILDHNNISYCLMFGTLIGSYVSHDLLPWDDDLDILVHNSSKARILELFQDGRHHGIVSYYYKIHPGKMIKVYFKNSSRTSAMKWRWPYVDILGYTIQNGFIVPVDKFKFELHKDKFFPFHRRPFGPLWLPAPRRPEVILRIRYGEFTCIGPMWDHRKERWRTQVSASCGDLKHQYPFVRRGAVAGHDGQTCETLMIGHTVYYSVIVDEPFQYTDIGF